MQRPHRVTSLGAEAADLVKFPVELGRLVVLSFRRILAEQEDQPAVVDVERVVVSVHLCRRERDRGRPERKRQTGNVAERSAVTQQKGLNLLQRP